jgi:phosphatidylglycerophosphatase C
MSKTLALFDFDGTLTTKDSLGDFIWFANGAVKTVIGGVILSPILVAYVMKWMPNDVAKQRVLKYFFSGKSLPEMQKLGADYAQQKIPQILRPQGLKKLQWHQQQGHRVVIVSASASLWLQTWAESLGVELLATQLEVKDHCLTGAFEGDNCHGQAKVERIKSYLDLQDYGTIYAYGDTSGDKPMLALATYSEYKPFR